MQKYRIPNCRRSLVVGMSVALCALLPAGQVVAQPVCAPALTVKQVHLSEVTEDLKRFWKATLEIDASKCVVPSGYFFIHFVRLAENAPDLEFAERFTWRTEQKQMQVVVEFSADEAVGGYRIGEIGACPCHDG
jgi:hypothetical protein